MRRRPIDLIDDVERSTLPWGWWLATFLAVVLARNLFEGILGPSASIGSAYFASPSALMVLDHFLFFYVSVFLGFSLLLSSLARERIGSVMKVTTPAWLILLIPPILDYFLTGGEGVKMPYVIELRRVVFRFFDPGTSVEGVSAGQRVEIVIACLLAATYVRLKTGAWWRAVTAFFGAYAIIAVLGVLPSLFARASLALMRAASFTPELAYLTAFKAGGVVADESRKLALLFMLVSCAMAWLAYCRHAPARALAAVRNVRPLRALHYVGMTTFGIAFGWVIFSRAGVEFAGAGDVLGLAATILATFFAFEASVAINDLCDEEGDRFAGEHRPLVAGALRRRDVVGQALVLSGAALLLALNVRYSTFLFMLFALIGSFVYSAPPIRLKRFPLVSSLSLGFVSLLACLTGFSVYAAERSFALFPERLAWLIVLSFGLGFVAKDLKDVDGDEATGVWTIPVLLGPTLGRAAVAALVFVGYAVVALLAPYRALAAPSIVVGLASAAMVYVWKRRGLVELLLAVCLVFTLGVALVVLISPEPLLDVRSGSLEAAAAEHLGGVARAKLMWDAAARHYADAAAVFPEDPEIALMAGAACFESGSYREALPHLERAVDLDASSPMALEYLAKTESLLGYADNAEWFFGETIRQNVRPGVFYAALGEHYMDRGKVDLAARAFERALALGRPDVPARVRMADAMLAAGRVAEARAQYELATKRRPSSPVTRDALGRFLTVTGDPHAAVAHLAEAAYLAPSEPVYWNNLGSALRAAGRFPEALQALEEATRLAPRAPEPYFNRGLLLDAQGRREEARAQYLLALELDPSHAPARAALEGRER